jgi:hypothetical protein
MSEWVKEWVKEWMVEVVEVVNLASVGGHSH